ncbi:peptide chain release factor N(5)-glutamine methyltransferase [Gilvimarinus sp. F26214L]|uniref:peptide chain release factor N(5)-glutamine methyltransferase n=1 Tax=Gilvimarinus sp. DZF01 TaxID=3461371 RepID=UPI0040468753
MATVAECLRRSTELQAVSDSARLDLELLLARALGKPRSYLYTWPEAEIDGNQHRTFSALLNARKEGRPMAHLLGEKEFWSLALKVDESTLIPRPETELLVECALEHCTSSPCSVLDLGTGTGAVALALASERPDWTVVAADKSGKAVQLAIENCRSLNLHNVQVLRSDWFHNLTGQSFDMIVSNPPYIDAADSHLQAGDLRFEPRSALVAKDGGLADIRLIANQARQHLRPEGWLLVEHGYDQARKVRDIFLAAHYGKVETRQDLGGRDRVTLGQFGKGE